mmetsp:Transcript_10709/g.23991  ORF Transcript_10709/g.23991 Transcript_10709/m.23991 type:complete len:257 (+) Transcript_10709:498-1268(+)
MPGLLFLVLLATVPPALVPNLVPLIPTTVTRPDGIPNERTGMGLVDACRALQRRVHYLPPESVGQLVNDSELQHRTRPAIGLFGRAGRWYSRHGIAKVYALPSAILQRPTSVAVIVVTAVTIPHHHNHGPIPTHRRLIVHIGSNATPVPNHHGIREHNLSMSLNSINLGKKDCTTKSRKQHTQKGLQRTNHLHSSTSSLLFVYGANLRIDQSIPHGTKRRPAQRIRIGEMFPPRGIGEQAPKGAAGNALGPSRRGP